MREQSELFEKVYQAVLERSDRYDGIYYTAIRTTGIYCRPSCRSRTPKPENVTIYSAVKAAERDGYRACKRCQPDIKELHNPDKGISDRVTSYIDHHYSESVSLNRLADEIKVSPYHLQRVCKRVTGLTPAAYLQKVRLDKAKEELLRSDLEIREIADLIGYKSTSHFIAVFQKEIGQTPQHYRQSSERRDTP
ncbi:Ada metal-binding domain-containing protein [Paenibacillus sp. GYB006]|uniref:bifunctional transcriptional activator/DNA repair enzyme AdaA n=1 Tax=Paenibacillus sp. GYB006 TaxID=2994394 RepID=UPI002F961775